MSSSQRSIIGSVLILISTLCLAFILSSFTEGLGWLDMTSNSRYTLTEGTKKIIAGIHRPLEARLYYAKTAVTKVGTDQLLRFNRAYFFTRDLLRAYEQESGGRVKFLEFDPKPFSNEAEEATGFGLQSFPLIGNQSFYFGLVLTSDTGGKEVLPFINANEESLFEYKITKMIERVSRPAKKKVGILSSLNVLGDNLSPEMMRLRQMQGTPAAASWNMVGWLRKDYDIDKVDAYAKSIPEDIDMLLVIHPKGLQDPILYALDQYVLRGGKLVVFVDPFCAADTPGPGAQRYSQFTHVRQSDLNRLLSGWGVKVDKERIMGDLKIAYQQPGQGPSMPIPMFTKASDCFNQDEAITQGLDNSARILTLYGGYVTEVDAEGIEVTPLISTTKDGGSRKFSNMEMMSANQNPSKLWQPESADDPGGFRKAGEPLVLAVRCTGKFKTAFPGGFKEPGKDPDTELDNPDPKETVEHIEQAKEPATVIVIADADLVSNQLVPHPNAWLAQTTNQTFLLNTLDYLNGSDDLINIRSRGGARREFDYILAIEKRAAEKTLNKENDINKEIQDYQKKLNELRDQATKKNVGLLQGQALEQESETKKNILKKKRELREVKREAREAVEGVQFRAQLFNVGGMPLLVILIAVALWFVRMSKRTRQMQEDMS